MSEVNQARAPIPLFLAPDHTGQNRRPAQARFP